MGRAVAGGSEAAVNWVFVSFESGLWTVGFYKPDGKFEPEGDYDSRAEAAQRVHYLNGGQGSAEVRQP